VFVPVVTYWSAAVVECLGSNHVREFTNIAKPSQQYRAVLLGFFGEAIRARPRGGQGDYESYC
jgi:hypothetical protein